jgi:alpha-galactosidase
MRGIPRQAVLAGTPIAGSQFTAADAGDPSRPGEWCPDMFGVRNNAAGQAWYDSLFKLFAAWGVDFVKVDDISPNYRTAESEMIRRAIDKSGRAIVYSISAGPPPKATPTTS